MQSVRSTDTEQLDEADMTVFRPDGGFRRDPSTVILKSQMGSFTRAQCEQKLRICFTELHKPNGVLAMHPRRPNESLQKWCNRLCAEHLDAESAFFGAAVARVNISRIDREEAELARAKQASIESTARKKLEIDRDEVSALLSVVEGAAEAEAFLAGIWQALLKHNEADKARRQLGRIRQVSAEGAATLRISPPPMPDVTSAPADALQFVDKLQASLQGSLFDALRNADTGRAPNDP